MVKLTPPHAVIFKESNEEGKNISQIDITNTTQGFIMFKVLWKNPCMITFYRLKLRNPTIILLDLTKELLNLITRLSSKYYAMSIYNK